jgi:hypothetical protein
MTAPEKRSRRSLYREPSSVVLTVGIVLFSFGFGLLSGGHHSLVAIVAMVVSLCLLIPMRVLRSRSGRWP